MAQQPEPLDQPDKRVNSEAKRILREWVKGLSEEDKQEMVKVGQEFMVSLLRQSYCIYQKSEDFAPAWYLFNGDKPVRRLTIEEVADAKGRGVIK